MKVTKLKNLKAFIMKYQIMLFNEIIKVFKDTYGKFQKTKHEKNDYIYNLIIDQIYRIKKSKLSSFDDKLMASSIEIINKNH